MNERILIILMQIILVFGVIAIVTIFIRVNNAIILEKRISKYSVKPSRDKSVVPWFDFFLEKYLKFVKSQRRKIKKLLPGLVKRYDKYIVHDDVKNADYVTNKFILSFLSVALVIIVNSMQGKFVTLFQLIFGFFIGFFLLDGILIIKNKINKKKIENDMLKAIIIINNAFKSGKSTMQAVEIASKKLEGPIGYEFKQIYEEMKYGLSVDTVFDRFAKRVNIEEAEYLSSSLTILNKTGGNIIAVFDSIERTLFDKKKLNEELKNSTTVSKLVVKILLLIPMLNIFVIYLFNPDYFKPFFASTLGYILVFIIILLFIIYAYLLDKIVRVDY